MGASLSAASTWGVHCTPCFEYTSHLSQGKPTVPEVMMASPAFQLVAILSLALLPPVYSISVLWIGWCLLLINVFVFCTVLTSSFFLFSFGREATTYDFRVQSAPYDFRRKLLHLLQWPAYYCEQVSTGGWRGVWVWQPSGGISFVIRTFLVHPDHMWHVLKCVWC